jgi:chromosome segregation ATPase
LSSDSAGLGRSLFGYRPASVRQFLADRETMFRLAQERADLAEANVQALGVELDAARAELTARAETTDAALTQAKAELNAATEALDGQTERLATLDATVGESQAQLALARRQAFEGQADSTRELADLREELEAARAELKVRTEEAGRAEARAGDLQSQLEDARALAERLRTPQTTPIPKAVELSLILDATERGVGRIVERARHAYEEELAQAERTREAAELEIKRFRDVRRNLEPIIRSVQQSVRTAGEQINRVPDQIMEAIGSMTEAITAVSDSLDQLIAEPEPVSLSASAGAQEPRPPREETAIRPEGAEPTERATRAASPPMPESTFEEPTEGQDPIDRDRIADAYLEIRQSGDWGG